MVTVESGTIEIFDQGPPPESVKYPLILRQVVYIESEQKSIRQMQRNLQIETNL